MSELDRLYTPQEVGDRYGRPRSYVLKKARAHAWPHVRDGRRVWFTAEHVSQIDELLFVAPNPVDMHAASWGRKTRRSA